VSESSQKIIIPLKEDFPLPKNVSICGEPMPLENPDVLEMFDRELTIAAWDRAQVFMWMKRVGRYFPYIEKALHDAGMPEDLKYITLAESALLTHISSPAGAKGPWQFMKFTARKHGLIVSRYFDERLNFEKATGAALIYLKNLKDIFSSWTLALAAYNCGEHCVKKAIEEQNVRDYYRLHLPLETERYVFRIAAAKTIIEDSQRYGYQLSQERIYKPMEVDTVQVFIKRPVRILDAARALGTDFKMLKDLNPYIIGQCLPQGRYSIKVPAGKGESLVLYLEKSKGVKYCKKDRRSKDYYIVKKGDTLTRIAKKTGISVSQIKRLNRIKGSVIMVGQKLLIAP
jgi:hypothetical protein